MNGPNLIVGGNLNFSLGRSEAWGPCARIDPLADYFLNMMLDGSLFDPSLTKITPTWRNNRVGEARIAKRLYQFLLSDEFSNSLIIFRQWVGSGGISDHSPILLELVGLFKKPPAPFKFNNGWLKDADYHELVVDHWSYPPVEEGYSHAQAFIDNMKNIKKSTILWEKEKAQKDM